MTTKRFLRALLALYVACLLPAQLSAQVDSLPAPEPEPEIYTHEKPKYKLGDEWASYISPGAGYSIYVPAARDSMGIFAGISTQFIWLSFNNNDNDRAPSCFQLYTRIAILNSNKDSIGGLISYTTGGVFSFEKHVRRAFVVPYFGIELGGLNQRGAGGGFQIAPVLGLQLFSSPYVMLHVQAGYNYTTRDFDKLSGIQANAGLNFFFWRD